MPIPFLCPHCGQYGQAPDGTGGQQVNCDKCHAAVIAPSEPAQTTDGQTRLLSASSTPEAPTEPPPPPMETEPPPIEFYCPSCTGKVASLASSVGEKMFCPHCNQKLQVPAASENRTVLGSLEIPDSTEEAIMEVRPAPTTQQPPTQHPPTHSPPHAPTPVEPMSAQRSPYDADRDVHHVGFQCPRCGSNHAPRNREEISTEGWIFFGVFLFFCAPLCWIGLLMKKKYSACFDCGLQLR